MQIYIRVPVKGNPGKEKNGKEEEEIN